MIILIHVYLLLILAYLLLAIILQLLITIIVSNTTTTILGDIDIYNAIKRSLQMLTKPPPGLIPGSREDFAQFTFSLNFFRRFLQCGRLRCHRPLFPTLRVLLAEAAASCYSCGVLWGLPVDISGFLPFFLAKVRPALLLISVMVCLAASACVCVLRSMGNQVDVKVNVNADITR